MGASLDGQAALDQHLGGNVMGERSDHAAQPGDQPLGLDLLRDQIRRHAPMVYFHPQEIYFPSTIEWYLAHARLVDGRDGTVLLTSPGADQLPAGPFDPADPDCFWLTLDPELAGPAIEPQHAPLEDPRRGDLDKACAYVRAVHHPELGATDLQFWMFYPFDGPGLARIRPVELGATRADRVLDLWPGGMHEADWELAVVRIDHATLEPAAFFGSQHKGGDAHLGPDAFDELEREANGQIRVYSSLYGHASYAHAEERKLVYLWKGSSAVGLELGLIDQTRSGLRWNLADPANHTLISTSWNDPRVAEPSWLQFPWRWGARDPEGGRFTRQFVDGVKALFEGRTATTVLLIHLLTLGLSAVLFAFAAIILGSKIGTRLLGSAADNSGPVGPRWQPHKWNGQYGFGPPPEPIEWRPDGHPVAHGLSGLTNLVCLGPVKLVSLLLGLLALPFLPRA